MKGSLLNPLSLLGFFSEDDIQVSRSLCIIYEKRGPPEELWKSLKCHVTLVFLQEGILMVPIL